LGPTPLGERIFLWNVGAITEDIVKEYVENQQTNGAKEAFKADD